MYTDSDPPRVLVVDDHPDAASSCAELLRLYGFDARAARCGCVGLALCASWHPDVALLDLRMPGADGFEVARRLREQKNAIRLVAVTGLATREYQDRATAAGFDYFLVKPVESAVLVDLVWECAATATRYPPRRAGASRCVSMARPSGGHDRRPVGEDG